MSDLSPFRQPGESLEHFEQRFKALILEEDWYARFQANGASYRAFREAIRDETDPVVIAELTAGKGESLITILGSSAISLWKDYELGATTAFEAEFAPRTTD